MKLEQLILALVAAIVLYFLSDYLFDKVTHRYYAQVPVLKFEDGHK